MFLTEVEMSDEENQGLNVNDVKNEIKKQKNKVVFLLGYLGRKYHGSASNGDPLHPTVEDALLRALLQCKLIDKQPNEDGWASKLSFQRASRTDRGVDALRNAISINIRCNASDIDKVPGLLQALLPDDIRIFDAIAVTSSFSSYKECTGRKYSYFLPMYSLLGPTNHSKFVEHVTKSFACDPFIDQAHCNNASETIQKQSPVFADIDSFLPSKTEMIEYLNRANALLQKYLGTHSFHNFALKGDPKILSMMRYITAASIDFEGNDGLRVTLCGQSFMHHQIRKMVSAVLCTVNQDLDNCFFESLLEKETVMHIPMLPSNGLVLESLEFNRYNMKLDRIQCHGNAQGKRRLDFSSSAQPLVDFTHEVQKSMINIEESDREHARWLFEAKLQAE